MAGPSYTAGKRFNAETLVRWWSGLMRPTRDSTLAQGEADLILTIPIGTTPLWVASPFQISDDGVNWFDFPPDTWCPCKWARMRNDGLIDIITGDDLAWSQLYVMSSERGFNRVKAGDRDKPGGLIGGGS